MGLVFVAVGYIIGTALSMGALPYLLGSDRHYVVQHPWVEALIAFCATVCGSGATLLATHW